MHAVADSPEATPPRRDAPPIVAGPLPRVLVQYLPSEALRRENRLAGLPSNRVGDMIQDGLNWYHPRYAEGFALASLASNGLHAGSLVLQVGFRCANYRQSNGTWTFDGLDPGGPRDGVAASRHDRNLNIDELIDLALAEYNAKLEAECSDDAELAARQEAFVRDVVQAAGRVEAMKALHNATAEKDRERAETSPLANLDAWDRVAHWVPQGAPSAEYVPMDSTGDADRDEGQMVSAMAVQPKRGLWAMLWRGVRLAVFGRWTRGRG